MAEPTDVFGLLESARALDPDGIAVLTGGPPLSYRIVHATAVALAASIRELGIVPGDRIAIMDRNTPAFLVWTFAASAAGAILVPLNIRLSAREIAAVLEDADPTLVVALSDFKGLIEQATASLPSIRRATMGPERDGGDHPMGLPLRTNLAEDFEPHRPGPGDVAHLYYTSGTTGRPKGVPLTHRNVVSHALAATSELDLASDDVWGHFAPMFHLADAWAILAITAVGGAHVFLPEFSPLLALKVIEDTGVTVTNLVPVMLQRMLHAAQTDGRQIDTGSLRLVMSGGAPIAPETVRAVLDVFRTEYVQTYGLTETSPYLTLAILEPRHRELSAERQLALRSRTGRPFETVELEVVDGLGRPVVRDDKEVGEIVARGSSITPGYWNQPEETAAAFRHGWFHTGDLATINKDGWVNIVDRKKCVIVSGGENVYSVEVENALYSHPSVLECAAFGVPSKEWGEEVRAAVVLRSGTFPDEGEAEGKAGEEISGEALREHCLSLIARYKVPRVIQILEELPKTGSGKIAKRLLRDPRPSSGQ